MRKVLVSLLVVAMVLGLVGTAAGAFTDTAKVAAAKYIDKATAFSWLKGYPDGTFKPAGNITRGEFAAVVVRALGLEAAATSTSGLTTKFSDVPKTHWAAGYINVATNKGVIKGYPDGTFKPEANVSNAEAITMIVRALNRESEATGEWPVGHISVAAQQSIIGSGFAANALATRGDVATYVSKAADVKWKELTTNGWVDSADKTFLKANTIDKLTGDITSTDTTNKTVTINVSNTSYTYTLADNASIANNVSLIDLKGYNVDLYKNHDTDKVLYIEPSTTSTMKKADLRAVGTEADGTKYFYFYDDSTKYIASTSATVVRNGATTTWSALAVDDTVTAFIGTDGKVDYVNSRGYWKNRAILTDMYTAGTPNSITIRYISSGAFASATVNLDTNCKVELNDNTAKLTDLAKYNVVSVAVSDPANPNTATIINATNKTVSGKVTAKRTTIGEDLTRWFYSVDGVEYRMESTTEVKDSDSYTAAQAIYDRVKVGSTVTAYLSQRGRVRMTDMVSGTADYGRIKRFVTNTNGSYDSWVLDMRGTETTYEVAKDSAGSSKHTTFLSYNAVAGSGYTGINAARTLRPGDYVALTLDNDNRINGVELLVNPLKYSVSASTVTLGDVYSGDKIVSINGIAYLVTNDTLLYVNEASGTMSSVAKDQKAAVAYSTVGTEIKLRALVVKTSARMDSAAITQVVGSTSKTIGATTYTVPTITVQGWANATDPWSQVQIQYGGNTVASTYLATAVGNPTDISDDLGGYRASFNSYRTSDTGYAGGFKCIVVYDSATRGSGDTATDAVHKGDQIVVKVTDKYGNTTSASFIVP